MSDRVEIGTQVEIDQTGSNEPPSIAALNQTAPAAFLLGRSWSLGPQSGRRLLSMPPEPERRFLQTISPQLQRYPPPIRFSAFPTQVISRHEDLIYGVGRHLAENAHHKGTVDVHHPKRSMKVKLLHNRPPNTRPNRTRVYSVCELHRFLRFVSEL